MRRTDARDRLQLDQDRVRLASGEFLRHLTGMMAPAQTSGPSGPHRFCIAPMMEWTDRHCRYFHRLLTRRALLYTEMLSTGAVLFGDRARLLGFDPVEHPVAVQLGGSDPKALGEAARICADLGYDEINLNVGCPSSRVERGRFGACLMAAPRLVAECVAAMRAGVAVPVTVKCRLGIDDQDPEAALDAFAAAVKAAGVDALIVHARKAWLDGLSPKENREVPPLDYGRVYRLKAAHPDLEIKAAGVDALIVHARKAWLDGLSPKENREVPPLDYGRVYRLKAAHPDL